MKPPPPLAIGVAAGLLLALLLAPATGTALGELARARSEGARLAGLLAARDAAEAPLVVPSQRIVADDPARARGVLARRIRAAALAGGVLVEEIAGAPAPPPLVAIRFQLSGAEKAVLALADSLERQQPLARLVEWRIEALPEGGTRLSGRALGVWQ